MTEIPTDPDKIQRAPIADLMLNWQKAWVGPTRGPLYSAALFNSPTYELIPEDQKLAEEPEREAYRNLVDGVASAIAAGAIGGNATSVIDEFSRSIPHQLGKGDTVALFMDVFTQTLDEIQPSPGHVS